MKIEWNKVTVFSKALALILFIALPILGFRWGIEYGRLLAAAEIHPQTYAPVSDQNHKASRANASEKVCADMQAGRVSLPKGAPLGYVKAVISDQGKWYVDMDYADWIADDKMPNGFRIANIDPEVRTFELSPDVAICGYKQPDPADLAAGNGELHLRSLSLEEFARCVNSPAPDESLYNGGDCRQALYQVGANDHGIDLLSEQYVP